MKRGFVIGLAVGLIIVSASFVLANTQIQAFLNDQIKVTLNGHIQEFKDETTNETQYPITYHNRTYLPLRTVANLVGVGVDYDSSSNTAKLETNNNINNWILEFANVKYDLAFSAYTGNSFVLNEFSGNKEISNIYTYKNLFSNNKFKKFVGELDEKSRNYNKIQLIDGRYYVVGSNVEGSDIFYIDTKLELKEVTPERIVLNAISYYYTPEDYAEQVEPKIAITRANTEIDEFVLIKEDNVWKVDEFKNPM